MSLISLTTLTFIFFLEILKVFSKFTALKINCKTKLFQRVLFWFCVLEMMSSLDVRQKQRAVIQFLVSKEEPPKKTFEGLVKIYGDASIVYSTVKKWVSRIKDEQDDPSLSSLKTDKEVEDQLQQFILETMIRLRNLLEMIAESLLITLLNVFE